MPSKSAAGQGSRCVFSVNGVSRGFGLIAITLSSESAALSSQDGNKL